jgi:glycosyltransferase involved in cell wall biosynthesis
MHVHTTPGAIGGSEVYLRLAMNALRGQDVKSSLICADMPTAESIPSVETTVALPDVFSESPAPAPVVRRLALELEAAMDAARVDVVHIHLGLRAYLVDYIARRWPVVYTAHVPVCPNGARYLYRDTACCAATVGRRCLTDGYRKHGCGQLADGTAVTMLAFARAVRNTRHLLRALQQCQKVIAPSAWQAERLEDGGIPSARLSVVHPPVMPWQAVSTDGPPVVAFGGRLVPFKGVDHLLWASSQVKSHHRLWIVGDGPARGRLESLARELKAGECVRFWGAVPPVEVSQILGQARVVVVPSLGGETFNLVGAEAAASGTRVVGYDVGGMRDWAERYPNADLVPARDRLALTAGIARALESSAATTRPGNEFSLTSHADALVKIYKQVTREGRVR